jgi:hypothetical protein
MALSVDKGFSSLTDHHPQVTLTTALCGGAVDWLDSFKIHTQNKPGLGLPPLHSSPLPLSLFPSSSLVSVRVQA